MEFQQIITADGLRAAYTVNNGFFFSDVNVQTLPKSFNLSGRLFATGDGRQIGYFKRRFLQTGQTWHVMHQSFYITDVSKKWRGVGRKMLGRALGYYATHGVTKVSMEAVADGRYVWLKYGFKPEKGTLPGVHLALRQAYKRQTGKQIPTSVRLPTHGPTILLFRYGGVDVGTLAMAKTESIFVTLDLANLAVRVALFRRGWLAPWRVFG